jgi:transcriptional regulator of acetoin/glycerol metabolism
VRELRNVVQRAALLSGNGDIDAGALGLPSAGAAMHGEEPDRGMIEAALSRANGVIAQAASDLGLSRQALYRRLDRLGIPRS